MLLVMIKKQLSEIFRSYFYDSKRNQMRSKGSIAAFFILFFVVLYGFLGGVFGSLSYLLCDGLLEAGMGWLYFLLLSGVAILFGAFGSVFNTYSSLYLAKDNDQLLSLPIPARIIVTARLVNVYLLGAMYSSTVLLPMLIVYWIMAGITAARLICGILLFLIVTMIVLILSCLLGWVVAKISLKLKNKSFITVIISIVFIGVYYFVCFQANSLIQDFIFNAQTYADRIKGTAYILYLFGRIGEGDFAAAAIFTAATAALAALVWYVLSHGFLKIATSGGTTKKVKYTEQAVREKTPFKALLAKEFKRFSSNASYMLNCGLGILLIPAAGILMLFRGRAVYDVIEAVLASRPGCAAVLFCAVFCMITGMNDMAAPSVSLEGKNIWILQSLPIGAGSVLHAKMLMQLILSGIPMLFASVCTAIAVPASVGERIFIIVTPLVFSFLTAAFDTAIGVKMPRLNWISEMVPIKQGGAVTIALLGGWPVCIVFGGLYLLIGYRLGPVLYLAVWTVLFAAAGLLLLRWLGRKGSKIFETL